MPQIPREPRPGERPEATTIIQIIRYLRDLARKLAEIRAGQKKWASSAEVISPALVLTLAKPFSYAAPEDGEEGVAWVTWGIVANMPPTNIGLPIIVEDGKKVWLKAITNGAPTPAAFRVLSVALEEGIGDVPEDSGGTDTTPPTESYFLIGEISVIEDAVSVATRPGGNLRLDLVEAGVTCFGPSDEFPTGGSRTNYVLAWNAAP